MVRRPEPRASEVVQVPEPDFEMWSGNQLTAYHVKLSGQGMQLCSMTGA